MAPKLIFNKILTKNTNNKLIERPFLDNKGKLCAQVILVTPFMLN